MDAGPPLPDNKGPDYVLILSSVVFASFMWKLDSTIVNISLPTITGYFQTSTAVVSRIILAYLLASTTTLQFAPSESQGVTSGLFNMVNTIGRMLSVFAFKEINRLYICSDCGK